MLFITTALYMEAIPYINEFDLKKKEGYGKFQVFMNNNILLIITGVGKINASTALAFALGRVGVTKNDIVINIGLCGGNRDYLSKGQIVLCNKLTDFDTNKTYFPDILYKHPFKEIEITTVPYVFNNNLKKSIFCVDMEAVGVYICANVFVYQHNIHIIKIVSDYIDGKAKKEEIIEIIDDTSKKIIKWIKERIFICDDCDAILNEEEKLLINIISTKLRITKTMKYDFIKVCENCKIRNKQPIEILKKHNDIDVCTEKTEGKRIYNDIRKELNEF